MNFLDSKTILEHLHWRYATKQFDPEGTLTPEERHTLLESARLSPSSIGLQPWKFLCITDNTALRQELLPVTFNQPQIMDADMIVIIARREDANEALLDKHIARTAEVQDKTIESLAPYKDMMMGYLNMVKDPSALDRWTALQCYIALGTLMTTAAHMGIDACPIEGFIPEKYDEILNLRDQQLRSTVVCAFGKRHADDRAANRAKVRFPAEDVIINL